MDNNTILFIDEICPKAYDPRVLETEALGGTEATVIRIAEGLASTGLFNITVEQHCRGEISYLSPTGAKYSAPGHAENPRFVISLRHPTTLFRAKERFPLAKHYLWNHDLMSIDTARMLVNQTGFTALAVSEFHKMQMIDALRPQGHMGGFPVQVLYNPVIVEREATPDVFDKDKLVWTSSPHKGLPYALELFQLLRKLNPDFRLHVANPGYLPNAEISDPGVTFVGALPHAAVTDLVQGSLCLFNPNTVHPETFGLCLAEADAVGTPPLTHNHGAAHEVCFHPYSVVDARNPETVVRRVMEWREGARPRVKAKEKFGIKTVLRAWERLLKQAA